MCRAELERGRDMWSVALAATVVHGSLRAEADVGFCTCRRGHRIVVKRAASPRLVVLH